MPVTLSDDQVTQLRGLLDQSQTAHQAHDAALAAKATADAASATADANEQQALKAEQQADGAFGDAFQSILSPTSATGGQTPTPTPTDPNPPAGVTTGTAPDGTPVTLA